MGAGWARYDGLATRSRAPMDPCRAIVERMATFARVVVLFLFGAIVFSFFDGFHTHSGTTRYADVVVWQAAWWVPLLFGASIGLGGPAFALGYRALGGARAPPPWSTLAAAFVAFGALYFFSGFYHGANAWKLLVLAVSAATLWAVVDRTWQGAACALGASVTGPLVGLGHGARRFLSLSSPRAPLCSRAARGC